MACLAHTTIYLGRIQIIHFIGMPIQAMRFPRIDSAGCCSAQGISPTVYRLQMRPISARSIPAQMVKNEALWYWSHKVLKDYPMHLVLTLLNSNHSITSGVFVARPYTAAVLLNNELTNNTTYIIGIDQVEKLASDLPRLISFPL